MRVYIHWCVYIYIYTYLIVDATVVVLLALVKSGIVASNTTASSCRCTCSGSCAHGSSCGNIELVLPLLFLR